MPLQSEFFTTEAVKSTVIETTECPTGYVFCPKKGMCVPKSVCPCDKAPVVETQVIETQVIETQAEEPVRVTAGVDYDSIEDGYWYNLATYDRANTLHWVTDVGDGKDLATGFSKDVDGAHWRYYEQDATKEEGYLKSKKGNYMWYGGGVVQTSATLETEKKRNLFHVWDTSSHASYRFIKNVWLADDPDGEYRYISENTGGTRYEDWGHTKLPDTLGQFYLANKSSKIVETCGTGLVWCEFQDRCIPEGDVCDFDDLATLSHGPWTFIEFRDLLYWFEATYRGKSLKSRSQTPGTYEHYMTGLAPNVYEYEGLEYKKNTRSYSDGNDLVDDPDDSYKYIITGTTYLATTTLPDCPEGKKWCEKSAKCIPKDEGCCSTGNKWCDILYKCIPDEDECKIPIYTEPGDPEQPYQLSEFVNQGLRDDGYYHFTNNLKWGEYNIDTMPTKEEFTADIKSKIPDMLDVVFETDHDSVEIIFNIWYKNRDGSDPTERRYMMGGDVTLRAKDTTKPPPPGSGTKKSILEYIRSLRVFILAGFGYSGYRVFIAKDKN